MANRTLSQNISTNLTYKKRCEETGWGLYASIDIGAREAIISIEKPLVISLDIPRLKDTCYECLGYGTEAYRNPETIVWEEDKKLQVCTGCHVVRYCSAVSIHFLADSARLSSTFWETTLKKRKGHKIHSLCFADDAFFRIAKSCLGNQYTSMNADSLLGCIRTSYRTTFARSSSSCFFGKQINFYSANGMTS